MVDQSDCLNVSSLPCPVVKNENMRNAKAHFFHPTICTTRNTSIHI